MVKCDKTYCIDVHLLVFVHRISIIECMDLKCMKFCLFYLENEYYLISLYTKGIKLMHNHDVLLVCAVLILM
jgi:hypothetical protein